MAVTFRLGLVPSRPASLVFEVIALSPADGLDANSPGVMIRTQSAMVRVYLGLAAVPGFCFRLKRAFPSGSAPVQAFSALRVPPGEGQAVSSRADANAAKSGPIILSR